MTSISRCAALLATLTAIPSPATAQVVANLGGPFSRDVVLNAPFSAIATTTVRDVLPDGAESVRSVTARYSRNASGAVRVELDTRWGPYVVVAQPGRERPEFFLLDPVARTYIPSNVLAATWLFNGESGLPLPVDKNCFEYAPLIEEKLTPAERLQAVNAEVLPGLELVRASHRVDDISKPDSKGQRMRRVRDYVLTEIQREEPPAHLFEVPNDYTFVMPSRELPLVRWTHPWLRSDSCKLHGSPQP